MPGRIEEAVHRTQGDVLFVSHSARSVSQFLARNLIREARIFTLPILLGAGAPLFPEGVTGFERWALLGSKAYPCGTVENHYQIPES